MALPSGVGYASATVLSPSASLTDFSLYVDLSRLPQAWWDAVDTPDGAQGRAAKGDGTELAADFIDFDDAAQTGWLRVLWSGTLSPLGGSTLRIYPPRASMPAYAPTDTYGRENAYDTDWVGYFPDGGTTDRTGTMTGTAFGGLTPGGASGLTGAATDFDGTDDYIEYGSGDYLTDDLTAFEWANMRSLSQFDAFTGRDQNTFWDTGWGYFYDTTLDVHVGQWDNGDENALISGFTTGTWHQIGLRSEGGVLIEALLDNTFSAGGTNPQAPIEEVGSISASGWFGGPDTGGQIDGLTAERQIHATVRSDAWMTQEYTQVTDQTSAWGAWSYTSGLTTQTLDGSLTGVATAAAPLRRVHLLSGTENGDATATASLLRTRRVTGSLTGAGTTNGTARRILYPSGEISSLAAASGVLQRIRGIEGTLTGTATAAGAFDALVLLDGSLSGAAGLDATVSRRIRVQGTTTVSADLAGRLLSTVLLTGGTTGAAALDADLFRTARITGGVTGAATLTGTFLGTTFLGGSLTGTAILAAPLVPVRRIGGAVTGRATADPSLTVVRTLSAEITGEGDATAALARVRLLNGGLNGAASLFGTFQSIQLLRGSTVSTADLTGAALRTVGLDGEVTGTGLVVMSLSRTARISGEATGVGLVSSPLRLVLRLDGLAVGQSDLVGDVFTFDALRVPDAILVSIERDRLLSVEILPDVLITITLE